MWKLLLASIMPVEQKVCCKESKRSKDHLLLSKTITVEVKRLRKSLTITWIYHKKTNNSFPH